MEQYILNLPSENSAVDTLFVLLRYEPGQEETLHYDVYRDGALLGTIYPAISECGEIGWMSDDLADSSFVERIGEEIERQDR